MVIIRIMGGQGYRIVNASKDQIALAAFNDELHLVYNAGDTLKWSSLALDDANRLGTWRDRTGTAGFVPGSGRPVLAASVNKLGLGCETSGGGFRFAEFDGSFWTTHPDIATDFRGQPSALGVFNGLFCFGAMVNYQVQVRKQQAGLAIFYLPRTNGLSVGTAAAVVAAGRFIDNQNVFAFTELDGALHVVFSSSSDAGGMSLKWARFIEKGVERSTDYETGHVVPAPISVTGLGLGLMAVRSTLWAVYSKQSGEDANGSVWVVPMPCH
jgi:hypothetical protein